MHLQWLWSKSRTLTWVRFRSAGPVQHQQICTVPKTRTMTSRMSGNQSFSCSCCLSLNRIASCHRIHYDRQTNCHQNWTKPLEVNSFFHGSLSRWAVSSMNWHYFRYSHFRCSYQASTRLYAITRKSQKFDHNVKLNLIGRLGWVAPEKGF